MIAYCVDRESMRHRRAKDSGRQSRMDEMEEEGFKEDQEKGVIGETQQGEGG